LVVSRGGITLRHEAAFEVTDEDARVEITLDRMPAFGSLEQNVNRWRRQVGLESIAADQLQDTITEVDIDGAAADMVRLIGPKETILGIVAVRGDMAWYFKLKGDRQLAEREQESFLKFAQSIRFP
jgi:hypothetical protein